MSASIEALPLAGQLIIFAIGGFGYAVAIAIAYLKGLPKKPEANTGVTIAGALISGEDADRLIGAVHSNSRTMERLERAIERNTDEVQRLSDHMIAERRH